MDNTSINTYGNIPKTDDEISDMSWFIEWAAYSLSGDNKRRQGFELKLKKYLQDRNLKLVKSD